MKNDDFAMPRASMQQLMKDAGYEFNPATCVVSKNGADYGSITFENGKTLLRRGASTKEFASTKLLIGYLDAMQ